jgi:hypothetical protein
VALAVEEPPVLVVSSIFHLVIAGTFEASGRYGAREVEKAFA